MRTPAGFEDQSGHQARSAPKWLLELPLLHLREKLPALQVLLDLRRQRAVVPPPLRLLGLGDFSGVLLHEGGQLPIIALGHRRGLLVRTVERSMVTPRRARRDSA